MARPQLTVAWAPDPRSASCVAVTAALVALVSLTGCGPKVVRNRIFDQPTARVELQHKTKSGEVIPRGFGHPATIADVRIAHILASLFFDDTDQKRRPVIRSEHVYDLAAGISKALAAATPDDEIAAAAFPTDRRLGIFTDDRVTSFRLHLEGDSMQIDFMEVEAPLEKEGAKVGYTQYEIPADSPGLAPTFTLQTGDSITKMGNRGVSVAWRDDTFRRPVSLRDRDGKGKRRTVLMELPPEKDAGAAQKPARPEGLVDEQIKALDLADADRASGKITEAEYQKRRRLILENRLDEAGYGKPAQ
jgi:hypothetical protein